MIGKGRVALIVTIILVINLGVILTDALVDTEQIAGPAASSYVTTGEGVAAWYELLDRTGHPVSRARSPRPDLDSATTVVVIEPFPDRIDSAGLEALTAFVESGGRLIAGGALPDWLREIAGNELTWSPSPAGTARPVDPAPETGYVGSVAVNSIGAWRGLPSGAIPLLADGDGDVTAAALDMGSGRIILLADTTALTNAAIGTADNASFALGIAGEDGRPVVFSEYVHGYTDEEGLTALPDSWLWAMGLGLAALLTYLIAIGRRFGPPEEPDRVFAPARREYLDALAGSLVRTGRPDVATAPIRAAARRLIAARGGLSPDATTDGIIAAARRLELNDDEIASIIRSSHDEAALITSGRVLARLTRNERPSTD
ncbi:MAG: DUF4350 domain-containing protein [Acidimicrobiia bacterium]|nr:DUF4350 domain-containing protein [Acidimicrobiia bacterium]